MLAANERSCQGNSGEKNLFILVLDTSVLYFFPDINVCNLNTDGCAHICTNTIGSYVCSCRPGYDCQVMDALAKVLPQQMHSLIFTQGNSEIDINECTEGSDGCRQSCFNTIGSYNYGCHSGYRLQSDGHTCNGIQYYYRIQKCIVIIIIILSVHCIVHIQTLINVEKAQTVVNSSVLTLLVATHALVIQAIA